MRSEARIERILRNVNNPTWRGRAFTFYRHTDPETERRTHLLLLNPNYDGIKVDLEGIIYFTNWRLTTKIGPDYQIFGRTQRGRDYHLNPPKTKTLKRLTYPKFSDGIEVAIRGAMEVRDRYRLGNPSEGGEAWQMVAAMDKMSQLRAEVVNFPDLTDEDLAGIVTENIKFAHEYGFEQPRLREKQTLTQLLPRGFSDVRGRKNPLAAHSRLFAMELAIRKRLEGAFPAILGKYATTVEVLSYEREFTRITIKEADGLLARVLERPSISPQSLELGRTSFLLGHKVRVRPYTTEARQVVENLGITDLLEGTQAAAHQQRRKELSFVYRYYDIVEPEKRIPKEELEELQRQGQLLTVVDFLKLGDLRSAKELIEVSRPLLRRVLDVNSSITSASSLTTS